MHTDPTTPGAGPAQPGSNELSNWLFESSPDCVKVLDTEGKLVLMNASGQAAMGIADFAPYVGTPWTALWPAQNRAMAQDAVRRAQAGQRTSFEAFCPTADGVAKWWEVQLTPVYDRERAIVNLLAVSRDITDVHHAHAALRAQEERLRLASEAAGLGLWRWDPGTDEVTWENQRTHEIFGLPPATGTTSLAHFAQDFIDPADRAAFAGAAQASCETGARFEFRGRIRRPDGKPCWIELFGRSQQPEDGSPPYVLGTVSDITERKLAEHVLRDAQARLETTLTAGEVATWLWDIRADRVHADRNMARLFAVSESDADGGPIAAYIGIVHPADRKALESAIARSIADGSPFEATYRLQGKDGDCRWVTARGRVEYDAAGEAVRLPGVVVDLTRQRIAEEKLRASEDRYRALFDAIDEGFCIVEILRDAQGRSVNYRFIETNPAFAAHSGFHPEPGMTVLDIFPHLETRWIELYGTVASSGEAVRVEDYVQALDRWFTVHAVPIGGAGSNQVAILFTDITERRRSEQELRLLAYSLAEVDQRKTEFLATLAHELRNPLAPISNGLQILRLAGDKPATIARVREMMERQVDHMVHLVNDLLDIARISSGKVELKKSRIDLKQAAATALEASLPAIEAKGHTLDVRMADEALPLDADLTRLAQVISNLLNNAAKYTPPGGRIELALRRAGGNAVLSVADNGVGIAPHAQAAVFDMFTQVKASLSHAQGGLGIGLSLVRRLVEMHGGEVAVASDGAGKGSCFTVTMPLAVAIEADGAGESDRTGGAPRAATRLRILVVDDNRDIVDSFSTLLELDGHAVCVAATAGEALRLASAFRPDMAFLDIGLPDMDGYALARAMRDQPGLKDAVLVALTGWGAESDRAKSRVAGFDHHIVKPVSAAQLHALLAEVAVRR